MNPASPFPHLRPHPGRGVRQRASAARNSSPRAAEGGWEGHPPLRIRARSPSPSPCAAEGGWEGGVGPWRGTVLGATAECPHPSLPPQAGEGVLCAHARLRCPSQPSPVNGGRSCVRSRADSDGWHSSPRAAGGGWEGHPPLRIRARSPSPCAAEGGWEGGVGPWRGTVLGATAECPHPSLPPQAGEGVLCAHARLRCPSQPSPVNGGRSCVRSRAASDGWHSSPRAAGGGWEGHPPLRVRARSPSPCAAGGGWEGGIGSWRGTVSGASAGTPPSQPSPASGGRGFERSRAASDDPSQPSPVHGGRGCVRLRAASDDRSQPSPVRASRGDVHIE
jgi:nitrite reductase/ring-hydroxylating ferredoxin subunit